VHEDRGDETGLQEHEGDDQEPAKTAFNMVIVYRIREPAQDEE
jgi:hypothetical protein